jgi:serine/threonine-protein kinase
VRVVLADDSFLFREGVARLLMEAGFDVVGQAADAEQLDDVVRSKRPDVAVVDIRMPPSNTTEGLVAAKRIRAEFPEVGVLVLSHYVESDHAVDLLSDGAGHVGYLLKDRVSALDEFADAVRRVGAGGSVIDSELVGQLIARGRETNALDLLTEREREVLSLMSEGRSNQAICEKLFLTPKTVESHVRSIFTKLGLLPAPDDHRRVLAVLTYLRS